MSSAARQPRLFCTNCGTQIEVAGRFCNKCGFSVQPEVISEAARSGSPNWPFPFPPLPGEKVEQAPVAGTVIWDSFDYDADRYEKPSPPRPFAANILVTNQRVVLMDRRNNLLGGEIVLKHLPRIAIDERGIEHKVYRRRPFPMGGGRVPLSPFWVFKRAANEELYKEFMSNPKGHSKVGGGAWWVDGYRQWSWIDRVSPNNDGSIEFRLKAVLAFSGWGPGRFAPSNHPEGRVYLRFEPTVDSRALASQLNAFKDSDSEPIFRPEFIASIPHKPETPGYALYTNIFWTCAAEVIPLGILWGLGAPLWLILLVGIGVAWGTLYLLKQFRSWIQKRMENPPERSDQSRSSPTD